MLYFLSFHHWIAKEPKTRHELFGACPLVMTHPSYELHVKPGSKLLVFHVNVGVSLPLLWGPREDTEIRLFICPTDTHLNMPIIIGCPSLL